MANLKVDTRLEADGTLLLNEPLAALLEEVDRGMSLKEALAESALSRGVVRRWREDVRRTLGQDPLVRRGRRLVLSETGRDLLTEFLHKNTSVRIFLTQGLRVPLLAVDGLVLVDGKLVAVKRRYEPFRDRYCLPGGMVEYGESVETAVVREVREETGLETKPLGLVGVYSHPDRDPRGHVVSAAFALDRVAGELRSGTDAEAVGLLDLDDLPEMGFDHNRVVADYRGWRAARRGD